MVRTDKRRALPASRWICPLFTLVLVGSTLASADSRPPEVGAPSGPQLEATRDLLYGPGLSTDESAYVDSWAPRDSAWWLDGQRAVDAFETRERLLGQFADSDVLIIGTHFATPTAGHIRRGAQGGYWLDVG